MSFSLPPPPANTETGAFSFVEEWADRVGTTPRALVLAGLTGLAITALAWVFWWRNIPSSAEITIPLAAPVNLEADSDNTVPVEVPASLLVHVTGAVAYPGVYRLEAEQRVGDAIAVAGGPTPNADVNRLNLAAPLIDGSRIYLPAQDEEFEPQILEAVSSSGPDIEIININTADQSSLETLPGVGPSTAAAIIDHRQRNGPFQTVDDLIDVRGIGEAKLAGLRDRVAR